MKKPNPRVLLPALVVSFGLVTVLGLAIALDPVPAKAAAPQPAAATSSKPSTKHLKFKGGVVTVTIAAITLRDLDNPVQLHTFTYSPNVHDKIMKIINKGGYQYGDEVTVKYAPGTTVALSLHGKPSKRKPGKF